MQYAFGDSYGGVAQNELALDAARDSRYFQSLQDQRSRERQQADYNLAQQQLAQANASEQARLAQAFAEHQDTVQYQQQALQQSAQEANANRQNEQDITQMRVAPYANKLDARSQAAIYNQAWTGINNGSIRTPQDLQAFSNALSPDDIARLMPSLQQAHNQLLNAFGNQQAQANRFSGDFNTQVGPTIPAYQAAQRTIQNAPPTYAGLTWEQKLAHAVPYIGRDFTTQEEYAQTPPPAVTAYKNALSNFETGMQKNKMEQNLQFDPTNPQHPFMPSMQPPPAWDSGTPAAAPNAFTLPPMSAPASTGAPTTSDGWTSLNLGGTYYDFSPSVMPAILSKLATVTSPVDKAAVAQQLLQSSLASHQARPTTRPPVAAAAPPLSLDSAPQDSSDGLGLNLAPDSSDT